MLSGKVCDVAEPLVLRVHCVHVCVRVCCVCVCVRVHCVCVCACVHVCVCVCVACVVAHDTVSTGPNPTPCPAHTRVTDALQSVLSSYQPLISQEKKAFLRPLQQLFPGYEEVLVKEKMKKSKSMVSRA